MEPPNIAISEEVEEIDDEKFLSLLENNRAAAVTDAIDATICPDCNEQMTINDEYEFVCVECGAVNKIDGEISNRMPTLRFNSGLKISNGNNSRVIHIQSDYSETQRRQTYNHLIQLNNQYNGFKYPKNILRDVAEEYNKIQQHIFINAEGKETKFVKRGNVKDEILGALLYYKCVTENMTRKRKDIAEFMKLPNNGISSGEETLSTLNATGVISIPVNVNPCESYTELYLERLELDPKLYKDFIVELIGRAVELNVGMSSIMNSKVIGTIWLIVQKQKLKIPYTEIETKCDGIKKNTFMKFTNNIEKNIIRFIDIFVKYNINHGLIGNYANFNRNETSNTNEDMELKDAIPKNRDGINDKNINDKTINDKNTNNKNTNGKNTNDTFEGIHYKVHVGKPFRLPKNAVPNTRDDEE